MIKHLSRVHTPAQKQIYSNFKIPVTGINCWHVFTTKLSDRSPSSSSLLANSCRIHDTFKLKGPNNWSSENIWKFKSKKLRTKTWNDENRSIAARSRFTASNLWNSRYNSQIDYMSKLEYNRKRSYLQSGCSQKYDC